MDHVKQLADMDRQAAARIHEETVNSLIQKYESRIKTISEQHKDGETIDRLMKQVCMYVYIYIYIQIYIYIYIYKYSSSIYVVYGM